ncbi:NUDIX domain-containing protein [Pseudodesulfovibrio sp.]|uniref:NUDIX domain-containing protein n=1 Tax=unclassified Pseudodesulfovibrio TaxID=2661612 RepID=UPI003AFFFB64
MQQTKQCPRCGEEIVVYRNPVPTVDVVIHVVDESGEGVVLVERRNPPHGWALPGGFVDYGESCEQAAVREALEETGLEVELGDLLGVYSDPARDPRQHTLSVTYMARARDMGILCAGDDAANVRVFPLDALPPLAFDHAVIIDDFRTRLEDAKRA